MAIPSFYNIRRYRNRHYNVDLLENQPEYTFYRFHNIISFVDYVEALALEWKNELA
ncbi:hypothetical protein [Chryseobacterium artocarpi]|uniref:hypothetical protein n=1 Tax=Chryseobacterium artocarpi TaxID=1414727 RepID=UPI0013F4E919|nr:hypothetical protein [Chryseobacterium artocarpi]